VTIPTDNLHDREVRVLAARAVRNAASSIDSPTAAEQMVYQDQAWRSWRLWVSAALGAMRPARMEKP
jgi:hypothetical protein